MVVALEPLIMGLVGMAVLAAVQVALHQISQEAVILQAQSPRKGIMAVLVLQVGQLLAAAAVAHLL